MQKEKSEFPTTEKEIEGFSLFNDKEILESLLKRVEKGELVREDVKDKQGSRIRVGVRFVDPKTREVWFFEDTQKVLEQKTKIMLERKQASAEHTDSRERLGKDIRTGN